MAGKESVQDKICAYLQDKIPTAQNITLSDFVQTAGGWSHEIYIFNAHWQENGRPVQRGLAQRTYCIILLYCRLTPPPSDCGSALAHPAQLIP